VSRFTEDQYQQLLRNNPAVKLKPVRAEVRDDLPRAPKPAKYRNTKVDGFDSTKERAVWQELELRAYAGEITELQRQVTFALIVNGIHVCDYRSDFCFKEGAARVVLDVKSVATRKLPAYRIKFKLMQACHGITIRER